MKDFIKFMLQAIPSVLIGVPIFLLMMKYIGFMCDIILK
jgi:hypothetical protein